MPNPWLSWQRLPVRVASDPAAGLCESRPSAMPERPLPQQSLPSTLPVEEAKSMPNHWLSWQRLPVRVASDPAVGLCESRPSAMPEKPLPQQSLPLISPVEEKKAIPEYWLSWQRLPVSRALVVPVSTTPIRQCPRSHSSTRGRVQSPSRIPQSAAPTPSIAQRRIATAAAPMTVTRADNVPEPASPPSSGPTATATNTRSANSAPSPDPAAPSVLGGPSDGPPPMRIADPRPVHSSRARGAGAVPGVRSSAGPSRATPAGMRNSRSPRQVPAARRTR